MLYYTLVSYDFTVLGCSVCLSGQSQYGVLGVLVLGVPIGYTDILMLKYDEGIKLGYTDGELLGFPFVIYY